jgi:hypothetical protein
MASFPNLCLNTSAYTTIDVMDDDRTLSIHIDEQCPLLYADHKSNTFIVDRSQLDDEGFYSVRDDLLVIDGLPVPFGQFCFLIYDGNAELISWSQSHECSTGKVCVALKGFGITASVDSPTVYRVDDKSAFKLKLKYGF